MAMQPKKFLSAEDFDRALTQLDHEVGKNLFLFGYSPIRVISAGGFPAVKYFRNREATRDLDYMIEPEHAKDHEIESPLQDAILAVAEKEKIEEDWMNNGLEIWATGPTRKALFKQAYDQNVVLFKGENLQVWAAPFEWVLERKLRRIAYSDRNREGDMKGDCDMDDAVALFKHFRDASKQPLDMEYFRNLNMNGFDRLPEPRHMKKVAANYQKQYKEQLFADGIGAWSGWSWSEEHRRNYRARENAAEPNGYEYEYGPATAVSAVNNPTAPASYATSSYPADTLVNALQNTQVGESSATATTSAVASSGSLSQVEEPYYYVHEGTYYYWNNQAAIEVDRPKNVWVKNAKGWSKANGEKYWRFWDGKKTFFQ